MKLYDLLDFEGLEKMLEAGYVTVQYHPTEPLCIYNYTHRAQYDRVWNMVTRQCRGLIVDDMNNVVARPWPKFFNYGEHEEGALDLDAPCVVTDKLDGSLGILYRGLNGLQIATRGSFTSEQALHATRMLHDKYESFMPIDGATYLFEIVYPENRIVLDYGPMDDLVLLAALETETGLYCEWDKTWPGAYAERFEARRLRDALAMPPRENAEGVVVRFLDGIYDVGSANGPGMMLKIKQDDYVALHRIVTGLNERVVWERLGRGEKVDDICLGLPDEFVTWVDKVTHDLTFAATAVLYEVEAEYRDIMWDITGAHTGRYWTRKDFAAQAKQSEHAPYLFLRLDERDLWPAIWRNIRPAGTAPRVFSEDTA